PKELENGIREAVRSGRFASLDEAMTEAASLLLQRLNQQSPPAIPAASEGPASARTPIWERILDKTAAIPDTEVVKLPSDPAAPHDHYLYGGPKRPAS